jgi:hypothetical protein
MSCTIKQFQQRSVRARGQLGRFGQGLGGVLPSKLEAIVWTIPAREAKNGLAHEVPLSGAVIELMADAGVPENIISKVLNHVEPGVTRRHYNLHAYRSEKRSALETWARYLEAILANKQPATGTVVPFRR